MSVKACVVGWPVEHSRSPLIHGHWLAEYGIDGVYTRQAVEPDRLEAFIAAMPENGFAGANVTVPHKEAVLALADEADAAARAIGAANTLWFENGKLHASNTDAFGFLTNLDDGAPGWDTDHMRALVLGAGGAARAVLYGLISRGVGEIRLANRTRSRAGALARHFGESVIVTEWNEREAALEGCRLLVNTTSLGMSGEAPLEFGLSGADENTVVCDLVYAPLQTELLAKAESSGLKCVDGLGMLLHQAVPGFEKWFGVKPEVTAGLRDLVVSDLEGA